MIMTATKQKALKSIIFFPSSQKRVLVCCTCSPLCSKLGILKNDFGCLLFHMMSVLKAFLLQGFTIPAVISLANKENKGT